jgi:DNA-binding NtrC family response regulator
MKRRTALIADDEPLSREFLVEALRTSGYDVLEAETGHRAAALFEVHRPDIVFSDLRMPDGDGLSLLVRVKQTAPDCPVVLVTAFGSVETAVRAMQEGADDFLLKPVAIEHLDVVLAKVEERERLRRENRVLKEEVKSNQAAAMTIVGSHPLWQRAVDLARRVGKTKATVLVRGESGGGKEVIASLVHASSDRNTGPFIRTNCAALQESLLGSELFGHEKGAFTGAYTKKEGRFELASGGTLLLDEIGEISLDVQAKLLRVLETGEFERVGGKTTLRSDVRLICATNRNLEEMIARGKFREDLFYRLNVVPIEVPPLRTRGQDVVQLADHFLARYAREFGSPAKRFSEDARAVLLDYAWPGNVRELANVVQRTALLARGEAITADDLGFLVGGRNGDASPAKFVGRTIADVEKDLILGTLDMTSGNKTHAARILGVTARTLANKMKTYRREAAVRTRPEADDKKRSVGSSKLEDTRCAS